MICGSRPYGIRGEPQVRSCSCSKQLGRNTPWSCTKCVGSGILLQARLLALLKRAFLLSTSPLHNVSTARRYVPNLARYSRSKAGLCLSSARTVYSLVHIQWLGSISRLKSAFLAGAPYLSCQAYLSPAVTLKLTASVHYVHNDDYIWQNQASQSRCMRHMAGTG